MKKCQAIKANGGRCQRIVSGSSDYCYSHDTGRSEERKRNAAAGGRVKGAGEVTKVKAALRALADEVHSGQVEARVGAVVTQVWGAYINCLRLELKVQELIEHENRLSELERQAGLRAK